MGPPNYWLQVNLVELSNGKSANLPFYSIIDRPHGK